MKFLKALLIFVCTLFIMQSCLKEYSLEDAGGMAVGTLKSDSFGDCLPSAVTGIYKVDSTLGTNNYIDVQVNLTTAGSYSIVSDTVNGYSFKGTGSIATAGLNTVRLLGTGKPLTAEVDYFTIKFGTSTCDIPVTVVSAATNVAVFTLSGAPNTCSGATVTGTYKAGAALNITNTVTINVNVTALGAYTLGAASPNGMFFTASGTFISLGVQPVLLNGLGTPIAAGIFNVAASNLGSNCTFSITVLPATGGTTAIYTLGGAPTNCTGVVLNGTYQASLATAASNTAKFDVTVATAGTYSITTTTVNGVSFSGTGSFATMGPQTVTLTASGTPTAAGNFNYPATGNASTCTFSVTYTAAAPPAVYTLEGAPGVCSAAVISGVYAAGTVLTSSNTVTIQANVTTMGAYTISTNTVNGMTFTASGVFPGIGGQTLVLVGTGTPVASGVNTFTPQIGTSSCTFNITVTSAATDYITCSINGVPTTFNTNALATLDVSTGFPILSIDGSTTSSLNPSISLGIVKSTGGNINAGTYTVNQIASGIILSADYNDAGGVNFFAGTDPLNQAQSPAFTIVISSITATRVTGTFTGPVKDNNGAGPAVKTITLGTFSVPF
jgi:hypothetical protein